MFSDWFVYFWPQIISPWTVNDGVFNLPWLFIILQPLRLLGANGALAVVEVVTLVVVILLARGLQLSPARTTLVVFSPPVLWCLFMGQIDGLILSAYLLTPACAVFLSLAKPQVLAGLGIEMIMKRPRLIFWVILLVLSAWLIWGWPFTAHAAPVDSGSTGLSSWNWSLWPFGVCLLPLLLIRDRRMGMLASPFIFPYAGLQSLIGPMLILAKLPWKFFIPIWILFWIRWAFMVHLF